MQPMRGSPSGRGTRGRHTRQRHHHKQGQHDTTNRDVPPNHLLHRLRAVLAARRILPHRAPLGDIGVDTGHARIGHVTLTPRSAKSRSNARDHTHAIPPRKALITNNQ